MNAVASQVAGAIAFPDVGRDPFEMDDEGVPAGDGGDDAVVGKGPAEVADRADLVAFLGGKVSEASAVEGQALSLGETEVEGDDRHVCGGFRLG